MKTIFAALILVSAAAFAAPPVDVVEPTALIVPNEPGYSTLYATEATMLRALSISWAGDYAFGKSVAVVVGRIPGDFDSGLIVYVAHVPVTQYIQFPKDGIMVGVGSYIWVQTINAAFPYVIVQPETYQLVTYTDDPLTIK